MKDYKELSRIAAVHYLLSICGGKLPIQKLYLLMYICQKTYLGVYGKRLFEDFFVLDPVYLIKPYKTALNLSANFDVVDDLVKLKEPYNIIHEEYMAARQKEVIENVSTICSFSTKQLLKNYVKDSATSTAQERLSDIDLAIIDDIEIAKAYGCDKNVVEYIINSNYIKKTLGSQC